MNRVLRPASLVLLSCLLPALPAMAQQSLVGKRVVVIKDKSPLAASGKEVAKVSECTVFTVDKVDGEWLWIKSERAYLRRTDVVPFEDAIAHYTRQLETNKTADNYWNRAQIWRLKGELDIALGDMNEAIRLNLNSSAWFHNRGVLWDDKKEHDKAIADYSEAIRLDPKSGESYTCRGYAWGKKKNYDKAIADYDEALKHIDINEKIQVFDSDEVIGGDSEPMVNSRALTLTNRGNVWRDKGDYDKAIADYEAATLLDPRYKSPRHNRRWVWSKRGEWNKVITELDPAIQAEPKNVKLIMQRANAWKQKPDYEKRFADLELVTQIDPKHVIAWNNMAWLRATCADEKHRNGQQTIEFATKSCELTAWKETVYFDTLAAAYAEAGDFAKAIEWQQKSMIDAAEKHQAEFKTRLKLYREQKPYREPAP